MNKQEKFTIWSIKFKVHRSNSQTTSPYPVRFSTYTAHNNNIFLIFFFGFCCFFLSFSLFFLRNKIWNIYIPIHTWLCDWISDKKNFHPVDFWKQDYFFWPLTNGQKPQEARKNSDHTIECVLKITKMPNSG